VTFLSGVAETGQSDTRAQPSELLQIPADGLRPTDRNDDDAFGPEIAAAAPGERFQRDPVADPFHEHDSTRTPDHGLHPRSRGTLAVVGQGAYLMQIGQLSYREAWDLQRALAAAVSQGAVPDTVVLLEHPPVITLGRRTDEGAELHLPEGAAIEVLETDRGGKSTYHAPGQLVCYPILDLNRHGRDVKRYVRDLEEALIHTVSPFGLAGERIEGLTGVWLARPPRKIASIGVHVSRWITTHGYALNVDLDPAPFTDWITACGLEDATFTTIAREIGRPVAVDEARPHAVAALADVFGLEFEELPADEAAGLWAQPIHDGLAGRR